MATSYFGGFFFISNQKGNRIGPFPSDHIESGFISSYNVLQEWENFDTKVTVPYEMISAQTEVLTAENNDLKCRVLQLRFENEMALIMFVPGNASALMLLEKVASKVGLEPAIKSFHRSSRKIKTKIEIPTLRQFWSGDLSSEFVDMGARKIFDAVDANFNLVTGDKSKPMNRIMHSTLLDIKFSSETKNGKILLSHLVISKSNNCCMQWLKSLIFTCLN